MGGTITLPSDCPDHEWLTLGTIWQGAVYVVERCPRCDAWRRQRLAACAEAERDEWGTEERAEAHEARNFLARTTAQFKQSQGEALVDEPPKIHKDEMSLIRWGFDPAPDDEFP